MRLSLTFLVLSVLLVGHPSVGRGQDSAAPRSRGLQLDSATLDTTLFGPRYEFTGREDPTLLAAAFAHVAKLGRAAARETPGAYCVGLGREDASPPSAVISLLANQEPPYQPRTFCRMDIRARRAVEDTSSKKQAWVLSVTALRALGESRVVVYVSYYVGPLWAQGWVCSADREQMGWSFHDCSRRWIS
jgi:hypothetical protein